MLGEIILIMCVVTMISVVLFGCLCFAGCFGFFRFVSPSIIRLASKYHDKPYDVALVPINNECFICLQKISNEVVASCNHSYCGQCIIKYIESNANATINCPACRKEIIVLFRRFASESQEQKRIKAIVSEYNSKYTQDPGFFRSLSQFGNILKHLPLLLTEHGLRYLFNDNRLKYIFLLAIYALSPFDILPEAMLGPLGLLDDGIALAGIIRQITAVLYGYIRSQMHRN